MSGPHRQSGEAQRDKVNLREQAYGSFTQHLLARDLRPGQFISQRELVELTGFTLGAIRELIPRLETEGLIHTVRKRGMQIAHVDLRMIRDAFQFRLFIEKEAVALFTQTATDAEIEALRVEHDAIIGECEAAPSSRDIPPELIEKAQAADGNLHMQIVDALENKIIADAYRVNAIKIRLIRQEKTQLYDALVVPTMREHVGVIDAIASRDPAAATGAMQAHILHAQQRALEQR